MRKDLVVSLKQYNFEPEYTAEEVNEMENNSALTFSSSSEAEDESARIGSISWCICGNR